MVDVVSNEIIQEEVKTSVNEDIQEAVQEKKIKKGRKHNNFVYYLLAFLIPVLFMLIVMIIAGCYPFGENTVLTGDANSQYLGFFREWLTIIENGDSFLFSWDGAMGYEFYTTYWYYLASPFNWLVLLFGQNHLELGMIFVFLLQVGGCGVTACYYFMHSKINKMKKNTVTNLLCLLFATAYAMCDFILAYQYVMIWLISLMLIPIVLLGIERLVDNKDGRLYVVSLFLVMITNFYFAWFVCIFAVIWFIDQKKENIKSALKSFVRFAGLSILAAASAAAVMIPCYLFVLNREDNVATISDYEIASFGNIGNFFQGFFWGCEIDLQGSSLCTNNNYCGIFVLFLVIIYIFEKKIPIKQKVKRVFEIVFLSFSLNWILTQYVFHGFVFPHFYCSRFAIILIFILIITAFEALQGVKTIRIRWVGIAAIMFICIVAVVLTLNNNVQNIWCYMVTVLVYAYLCICLILLKRKSIKKRSLYINILIIGFAEIISNAVMVTNIDSYKVSRENDIQTNVWSDDYLCIETSDGQRKKAWIEDKNCFQYSDTDTFSSVINSDVLWFFADIGLIYQNNGGSYAYRGSTPLTAALLNVDYILTDSEAYFGGYVIEKNYNVDELEYGLYTTAYDAEIGFMLPETVLEWNTNDENPFEVQNNFTRDVLNQDDIFSNIIFEDPTVESEGLAVTTVDDSTFEYVNINLSDYYGGFKYTFTVPYDMNLYACVSDSNSAYLNIYIDGETYLEGGYFSPETLVSFGELKSGQVVEIEVLSYSSVLSEGTTYIDFYTYNDEVMQECLEQMNENPLVLDTFDDTYVSGTVTAEEDGVLYTSIPYYKGWTLYVDGVETEITKIADAFVGVELSAGEHTIELKYFPYGLKVGIVISLIGLAGACIYFIYFKKRRNAMINE